MSDEPRLPPPAPSLRNYRLVRALGEGGMGTVYLAEDLRLEREIALKVLPEAYASDGERRARFQREARLLASLSHPGIVTVYSVEEDEGVHFITMELVDGKPLSRLVGDSGLPLARFFPVAIAITEALAAAHDRGIVHRDLKPGNVMVAASGTVKVLDFGLARQGGGAVAASGDEPTTLAGDPLTQEGRILGTIAYMSPEQCQGKPIDPRSDLFSLGVVFHQMLTGTRPFRGDSWTSTLAAVVRDTPPVVSEIRTDVPRELARVVTRLLEKDPRRRYQSALDVSHDLEAVHADIASGALASASARRRLRWLLPAAGAVLGGALALAATLRLAPAPARQVVGMHPITSTPGLELFPQVSPDGKLLAYASGRPLRIRVRQLDGGRSVELTDSPPADQLCPRWSPDGTRIVFQSSLPGSDSLWVVPALGGSPRHLEDDAHSPAWSPDATQLAFFRNGGLYARPAEGGEPREVLRPGVVGNSAGHSPAWSPDGTRIAFVDGNASFITSRYPGNMERSAIRLVPAAGGEPVAITTGGTLDTSPEWAPDGSGLYFVSSRGGGLDVYFQRLARSGAARGDPERLTSGLHAHTLGVSSDGKRLVVSELPGRANLWSVRIPGPGEAPLSVAQAVQVTFGHQSVELFGCSRDGRWLAYDSNLAGNQDIYRVPIEGGEAQRLTSDPADDFGPSWSPDGRLLVFYSLRSGKRALFTMNADGGPARPVLPAWDGEPFCPDWSPDGRGIAFMGGHGLDGGVWVVTANGQDWEGPRLVSKQWGCPRWSPDGRRIAFAHVSQVWLITTDGDTRVLVPERTPAPEFAAWSADSTRVYFKSMGGEDAGIWEVAVTGGEPRLLVRFDDPRHEPSRQEFATDGKRFYFTVRDPDGDVWILDLDGRR